MSFTVRDVSGNQKKLEVQMKFKRTFVYTRNVYVKSVAPDPWNFKGKKKDFLKDKIKGQSLNIIFVNF